MPEKKQGKIKDFNTDRGFGFIIPDDGGKDAFFHIRSFLGRDDQISKDKRVSFEPGSGPKGPVATNVSVV